MTYIGKIEVRGNLTKSPFQFSAQFEQFESKEFCDVAKKIAVENVGDASIVEFQFAGNRFRAIALTFDSNTGLINFIDASQIT